MLILLLLLAISLPSMIAKCRLMLYYCTYIHVCTVSLYPLLHRSRWSQDQLQKTEILHAGRNSQPSPVTTINGYTLEICNDILYLGVSTKTPLNEVQDEIVRAWFVIGKLRPIFISKISDAN